MKKKIYIAFFVISVNHICFHLLGFFLVLFLCLYIGMLSVYICTVLAIVTFPYLIPCIALWK
jgi:hypothetical protein